MARHSVCKLSDLPPGQNRAFEVGGTDIAVFNVEGTLYATADFCRHRGGSLGEGELQGHRVQCPLHGWVYDVTNGECLTVPEGKVDTYPVTIEAGDVMVEI